MLYTGQRSDVYLEDEQSFSLVSVGDGSMRTVRLHDSTLDHFRSGQRFIALWPHYLEFRLGRFCLIRKATSEGEEKDYVRNAIYARNDRLIWRLNNPGHACIRFRLPPLGPREAVSRYCDSLPLGLGSKDTSPLSVSQISSPKIWVIRWTALRPSLPWATQSEITKLVKKVFKRKVRFVTVERAVSLMA